MARTSARHRLAGGFRPDPGQRRDRHLHFADAELLRYCLLVGAVFADATHGEDRGTRQLGLAVLLAVELRVPALPDGVLRVVFRGAEEEMRGIHTGADIAAVKHQPVVVDAPMLDEVADAMNFVFLIFNADDAVTVLADEPRPEPARAGSS